MQYMVSYSYWSCSSGNMTGTLDEVLKYTEVNKHHWKSFTFFRINEGYNGVNQLVEVDHNDKNVEKK